MTDFVNISTWGIMSGVLVALIIFFVMIRRISKLGKIKTILKVVVVVVVVSGSYLLVSLKFNQDQAVNTSSVPQFPSTGPNPAPQVFIQFVKSLYATPLEGLITSFYLVLIVFVIIKIIRPDRRQIEKDLADAKIAAQNVLEDLQFEKERLAEANAKNEAILYSIGDGVFAIDINQKIIMFNNVSTKISGFSAEEAIGRNYRDILRFVREGDGTSIDAFITKTLEKGEPTTMESGTVLIAKDGHKIPVADSAAPFRDIAGRVIGCVVVFHDITKEKELDRVKSEFISIASHQLRTPVSGLSWLTEALEFNDKNLDSKQKKYVKDLSMLSKRLIELVEDLLNISRIELKTPLMTEKVLIEMSDFIETFIKEIKPYADSRGHSVVFNKSTDEPVSLELNKKSLYNVLQNLVSNAIEYSPENTVVTVNLEKVDSTGSPQAGDFIKISISNQGSVISKGEQSRLFEKFYRAESAKKIKAEGTGLGLYIVKMIIEGMGGRIGLSSEVGDTTFWFTIPLKRL